MKLFPFISLLLILLQPLRSQDYFHKTENQHTNNLVLVHPTLSNLERYTYLIDEGILDPGGMKVVGLCFEAENYNYDAVIRDYPEVGFHIIGGTLCLEDLFRENAATDEFRKVFNYSSGIIFNGGPDIPPATYGEEMSILTIASDPFRHYYELSFLFHLLGGSQNNAFEPFLNSRPGYAVLGICLGMQSMNVATGGDLIQDIPSEIYNMTTVERITAMDPAMQHRNYYSDLNLYPGIRSYILHPLKINEGSRLEKFTKKNSSVSPVVFSSHHQAIGKIGNNLQITATSADGKIAEAMEHTLFPNVLGVQFHPEVDVLYRDEKTYEPIPGDDPISLKKQLKETGSDQFHLKIWKSFSELLNSGE